MHGGGKISMPPVVGVQIFSGTTQSPAGLGLKYFVICLSYKLFFQKVT